MAAKPNTAHMFIVNPLKGGNLTNLFSTHPPLEERIARLRGQKGSGVTHVEGHKRNGIKEAEEAWKNLSR